MNVYQMRKKLGYTQKEFADKYNIPFRTIKIGKILHVNRLNIFLNYYNFKLKKI